MTDRTAPIELVQAAVGVGMRLGIDVNQVLKRAGVSAMLLVDGRSRVTEGQVARVVQELWRSTDDEMFGLGEVPLPRGSFRLLCFGLLTAPNLGAALERFAGFASAMPALPRVIITTNGDAVRIALRIPATHDPGGLSTTVGLTLVHRLMGWAIGRPLRLISVELPNYGPLGPETHRLLFGTDVRVGVQEAALEFEADLLNAPLVRDEHELEQFIATSPAGLLGRTEQEATVADQVRRIFEHGLKTQDLPTSDQVARRLAMSAQTLRRKLSDEQTSTREIRQELIRDAAVTSLVKGDESVAELAERLGFSEPSAFSRAFRRWTGSTPGAYRRADLPD